MDDDIQNLMPSPEDLQNGFGYTTDTPSLSDDAASMARNNSMNDGGRGGQLGQSSMWEAIAVRNIDAMAQTGVNVWAARNGVYAGGAPRPVQNAPNPAMDAQRARAQTGGLMQLLLIGGIIYLIAK